MEVSVKKKIEKVRPEGLPKPEVEKAVVPEASKEAEAPPSVEIEKAPPKEAEVVEEPTVKTVVMPTAMPSKSETLTKIENILEEDLQEMYFSMPPDKQHIFKERGEETASRIEKMIETGKAVGRKILKLITSWLKLIPGVNKFFLEQEAKIKTDKIVALAEKKKME